MIPKFEGFSNGQKHQNKFLQTGRCHIHCFHSYHLSTNMQINMLLNVNLGDAKKITQFLRTEVGRLSRFISI